MSGNDLYRGRLLERLEREKADAHHEIARAQAEEAQARAKVAEKTADIERVLTTRDPQADECKRCRFEFGRTSVLRPMPSKSKPDRFQCPLCGDEDERE